MGYNDDIFTGFKVGYFFDCWGAIDMKLTGKEHTNDSGALEDYAKAIEVEIAILGDGVLFCIDIAGDALAEGDSRSSSSYFSLDYFTSQEVKEKLDRVKQKLTATGFEPDDPVIVVIDEDISLCCTTPICLRK